MKILILLVALAGFCCGDPKIWQRDVNFGNPDNWSNGKVPCASDSIKFPESMSIVFMQTNTTLREIRLPLNGALVFDNNVRIAFTDDSRVQPECTGQEQSFVHDTPESWFDPANWAGPDGPLAVDTENVPCQYDQVVFPTQKLFYVGVDLSTSVGTISFSEEDFVSTSAFSSFLRSPSGMQQFSLSNTPTIRLQNSQCRDLTGCVCGNDVEPVRTKICGFRNNNCPAISCRDAPTPVGSCCAVCGAVITMEYDPQTFNFQNMKTQIESKFGLGTSTSSPNSARKKRQADSIVTMYMSKTSENKIQMVFTDSNAGSSSGQAASSLASDVQNDISQNSRDYGITTVEMQSSEKGTGGLSGGVKGGGIAGIILAVIIIVCVVSTVVFLFMRRNQFAMKDEPLHADSDIEMSQGIPPGFMQEISNPAFDAAIRGFDNPMYATTKENLYADPAEIAVKVDAPEDEKPAKVVEEKGAINGPNWEEDENMKAFSNPMAAFAQDESNA